MSQTKIQVKVNKAYSAKMNKSTALILQAVHWKFKIEKWLRQRMKKLKIRKIFHSFLCRNNNPKIKKISSSKFHSIEMLRVKVKIWKNRGGIIGNCKWKKSLALLRKYKLQTILLNKISIRKLFERLVFYIIIILIL